MSVVCQGVLVVDEVFAQSQKMLAKSPHAINIHRPLGAYGSIGSLVYGLDPYIHGRPYVAKCFFSGFGFTG